MMTGARLFMLVGASGLVMLLGLPLLICPMTWGRRLGWTIPEPPEFANYLDDHWAQSRSHLRSWGMWRPPIPGNTGSCSTW